MPSLLMINPKERTPAQKRATKKMIAANKKRRSGSAAKKAAPASRKAKPRSTATPRKRPQTTTVTTKSTVTRRTNPIRRRGTLVNQSFDVLKDGAVGSVGAVAAGAIGAYLPVPQALKDNRGASLAVNAGIGIALGMLVGKLSKNKKLGAAVASGAVTVALHGAMKEGIGKVLPSVNLGGADDIQDDFDTDLDSDLMGLSAYVDDDFSDGLGAYVSDESLAYTGAGVVDEEHFDLDSI